MMRTMIYRGDGAGVTATELPTPVPAVGQVLVRVRACAVCRTDLHVVDGDLTAPKLPVIPGHEVVGTVERLGPGVADFAPGMRIGVPWLGWTCNECAYCRSGRENLCDRARFTGYTLDGGYAEYMVADHRYCFHLPDGYDDAHAAPLLCAGLIGYRALRMAGDAARIGLFGFGAAAHLVAQVAKSQGRRVFAFTRPGDATAKEFARAVGVDWVGDSTTPPPEPLEAALLFAPVGALVPQALRAVCKGGSVICAGIHMSDIPSFPYELLWEERVVRSVANLTRRDAEEFLAFARAVPLRCHVETVPLEQAQSALDRLRDGRVEGALVLVPRGVGPLGVGP